MEIVEMSYYAFVILFIFTILLALIYIRGYFNPLRQLPGQTIFGLANPILGIYYDFMKRKCSLLSFVTEDSVKYGGVRRSFTLFGNCRLNITDPQWIKVMDGYALLFFLIYYNTCTFFVPFSARFVDKFEI